MEISLSVLLLCAAFVISGLLILIVLLRKKRGFNFQDYMVEKFQSLVKKK